jgi:hypothetical protein
MLWLLPHGPHIDDNRIGATGWASLCWRKSCTEFHGSLSAVVWFRGTEAFLVNLNEGNHFWGIILWRWCVLEQLFSVPTYGLEVSILLIATILLYAVTLLFLTSWRCQHRTEFSSHSRHFVITYEHCQTRPRIYRNSISRRQCRGRGRTVDFHWKDEETGVWNGIPAPLPALSPRTIWEELLEKLDVELETGLDSETCLWGTRWRNFRIHERREFLDL